MDGTLDHIARIIERHLPFLVETWTTKSAVLDESGYEPGLIDSNAAAVFAYAATLGGDGAVGGLAVRALERVATFEAATVPPLAWNYVAWALTLAGDRVDREVRERLVAGVTACADRLLGYVFPTGLYRDTKAEETCWTAGPLVGALALSPSSRRAAEWEEKAHCFFLNSYNRESDAWSERVIEGAPLRSRVTTANLFEDFTCENHGAFHTAYQTCINNYAVPYLLYRDTIGRVPESLTWNWEGLHSVMRRLIRGNGRIFSPAGTDYFPYSHAEQMHYLALVAVALDDDLAYGALRRAAERLLRFQEANDGRLAGESLGDEKHLYWEYHFASFVVFAHALLSGVPAGREYPAGRDVPGDDEALAAGSGPWSSPYCRFTIHKAKRFEAGYAVKSLLGRRPGSGFVVPQSGPIWTDHFCTLPSFSPVVRDVEGNEVRFVADTHIVGHDDSSSFSVAAWNDERQYLRRTSVFYTHEEGVLHIERIMRYGEQVPIFGSDSDLAHSKAEGDEFGPWSVETLNYRVVNDPVEFDDLTVETAGETRFLRDREERWESSGDRVLIGGRIGIIRLRGDGPFRFTYRFETEPLSPTHYWKHRTWALNVAIGGATPPPTGYGLMGGHAVLVVPASSGEELAEIAGLVASKRISLEEDRGRFRFCVDLGTWRESRVFDLGHLPGLFRP